MKKMVFLLFLILLIPSAGCASEQGPWHGKVIDAETKQPIEGAVVVAVFHKSSIALGSGPVDYFYAAKETLTDKNGEFNIPVFKYYHISLISGIKKPEFTIFKPGYGSFPYYQISPQETPYDLFLKGAVVELPKITDKNKRLEILSSTEGRIDTPYKKVPIFIKLINEENANLGLQGRAK